MSSNTTNISSANATIANESGNVTAACLASDGLDAPSRALSSLFPVYRSEALPFDAGLVTALCAPVLVTAVLIAAHALVRPRPLALLARASCSSHRASGRLATLSLVVAAFGALGLLSWDFFDRAHACTDGRSRVWIELRIPAMVAWAVLLLFHLPCAACLDHAGLAIALDVLVAACLAGGNLVVRGYCGSADCAWGLLPAELILLSLAHWFLLVHVTFVNWPSPSAFGGASSSAAVRSFVGRPRSRGGSAMSYVEFP